MENSIENPENFPVADTEKLGGLENQVENANKNINQGKAEKLLQREEKRLESLQNITEDFSDWSENDFREQRANIQNAISELELLNEEYLNEEMMDKIKEVKNGLNLQLNIIENEESESTGEENLAEAA